MAVLGLLLLLAPQVAQAQAACEQDLAPAQEAYTFGRFDEAIGHLDRCLGRPQATNAEREQAHRLLALSYLGKDEPSEARAHVRELLTLNRNYRPDEAQDPPPFIQMIDEVRRTMADEPSPPGVDQEKRGISKWVWIGGGVVVAAVAAAVLLSGGGDDDDDGGGNGQEPTTLDEREPNNTPAQAQVIRGTPPVTVRGNAATSDFDPVTGYGLLDEFGNIIDGFEDLYQVTISQPGLRITLSGLTSDGDIHLVNLNNTILAQSINPSTSAETINDPNLPAGTYLIAVSISDDVGQQGLPASTAYTLVVDGAVTGTALAAAQQRLQAPGGEAVPGTLRLVAHSGGTIPLQAALPDPAEMPWAAFAEHGTRLSEYDATDAFAFEAGRGIWVQSDVPFSPRSAKITPIAPGEADRIPLHPGWNIIANPRGGTLDWVQVQAANGIAQALWRWDGHYEATSAFEPAQHGEAYYFLNASGLDALRLPSQGTPISGPSRSGPVLTLAAYRGGQKAASIQVGWAADASVGMDRHDQAAPPGYFEAARLRLVRDLTPTRRLELAAEYRPPQAGGQRFEVLLEAPPHVPITLQADGLDAFAGYAVSLVDPERSAVYDLRRQPVVTLTSSTDQRRLQLIIGSEDFVAGVRDEWAPTALALDNYPNPFNPQTTLTYTVPSESQNVRLELFDVVGRSVRLLVEGRQEAGTYEVTWDGTSAAGLPLASGLYLARLHVGDQIQVRRMLLMK